MEILEQQKSVTLSNGEIIPQVGLGVLKAQNGLEVENAVITALENGYRLIDTAAAYRNEDGVGRAIKRSGVPREDIFLTTKVWNSDQGYEETLAAFERSLKLLQTDYVDLYLVHWPVAGKYKETWRALEKLYKEGKAKAIGVSNFQIHHLQDLMATAEIKPMVNQVEMHPYLQQKELQEFSKLHHIQLQAWRPIMMGEVNHLPAIRSIAEKLGKSPVQVTLRWLVQKEVIVIPKSVKPNRIKDNIDIFDFELSPGDMAAIEALDQGKRLGPDPDNFNF
ncbi:MAG: aldo/keto reductase [Cytophagales bacterium]|nr:aldo/keto reductase [Cytophagales bacterium]